MVRPLILSIMCVIALLVQGAQAASPATRPAAIEVRDLEDHVQTPLELGEQRAAVIVFIGVECPVSNAYAPEIDRLWEQYRSRHIAFYVVYSDHELTQQAAREHYKAYGFSSPALLDPKHELARRLGAKVTPEAVLVGAEGKILYRGRIDNLYYSLGKRRPEATVHDLLDAIDATLAKRDVATPRTRAIGCTIDDD